MSKVTYHEFRPGHWVKLVDGKIVGRATAEEVAAWKREQAAQTVIWQDVVQRIASAEPKPEIPPEKPLPAQKAPLEPVTIWQDVLSQISGTEPRKEGQLQEAKVKKETERIPEKDVLKTTEIPQVVLPQPTAKTKPESKDEGKPAEQATKVKPAPTAKTVPAEAVVAKPVAKSKPKVEKEATVAGKAKDVPPEVEEAEAGAMSQPASMTATRRTAAKPSSIASRERPSQLYLWIMAGASDDLIATVRSGLARYQERFHQPAEVVLCHVDDMAILEKANLPVDVRQGKGVPPRNFWIGLK